MVLSIRCLKGIALLLCEGGYILANLKYILELLAVCWCLSSIPVLVLSLFVDLGLSPFFPALVVFSWVITIFFNDTAKGLWDQFKSWIKWKSNKK